MQVWGGNRGGVRGSSFAPEKGTVTVRVVTARDPDQPGRGVVGEELVLVVSREVRDGGGGGGSGGGGG